MHWPSITFDWNQVRAFLATVEEGSFSAAARVLGLTQPTLGRQVAALEQALGVTLFERAGKALVLTASGLELLDHVRAMGDAAARISLTASGQATALRGQVRITASDVLSAYVLPRAVARLRARAPELEIDIIAANDIRDLQQREADIAIRHVRPEQPELIARLVREAQAHLYAAPRYLDRHGTPATLDALAEHSFIAFGDPARMIGFFDGIGLRLSHRNFPIRSENGIVGWEMARAGLGIAVMSEHVGTMTPDMRRILPDLPPIRFPIWLTTHRELHTSRRIRVVFDLLADVLARTGV